MCVWCDRRNPLHTHMCVGNPHTPPENRTVGPTFSFSSLFEDPSSYCDWEWNGWSMARKKEVVSVAMLEPISSYCSLPYHAQHHKHMAGRSLQKPFTSLLVEARSTLPRHKRHFTRLLNCFKSYHKTPSHIFFIIPFLPAQTWSDSHRLNHWL